MYKLLSRYRQQFLFLSLIYLLGLAARLFLRLGTETYALTFNADIWYRLSMAQYFSDYGRMPEFSIRYLAYGQVPCWYPPVSPIVLSLLSRLTALDLPTVCSRIVPFLEAATPLPFFFLARRLYGKHTAVLATLILALTPSFIYWTGIADPQSLTMFLIPLYILMLIWRNDARQIQFWKGGRKRLAWILLLGTLLAINFLTHLSFFLAVIVLFLFAAGMKIEKQLRGRSFLDLTLAVGLSQILTCFWWAPKHLYWWWVKALVTSSSGSLRTLLKQLLEYGLLASSLGIFAVLFFLCIFIFYPRRKKQFLIPIFFWLAFVFLETQIEQIMSWLNRLDLTWSPLVKPLEGYRFFCFLAQPLSLLTALVVCEYDPAYRLRRGLWKKVFIFTIGLALCFDLMLIYRLPKKWGRAGVTASDYRAAVWFRENSREDARIVADYYRGQMFAGVCAGRALLGGLFPLRNVQMPYISRPAVVQDDIYRIYATDSASEAHRLMRKYGATHLYYSKHTASSWGFGSKLRRGQGVELNKDKFKNERYFSEVYREGEKTVIIKAKELKEFWPLLEEELFFIDEEEYFLY